MSRLDDVANILALAVLRKVARQADSRESASVTSVPTHSQGRKGKKDRWPVAFVSDESVHVLTPSPVGLGK